MKSNNNNRIQYDIGKSNYFYEAEIKNAIRWLMNVQDVNERGWAWVQFIQPNEQNTAEVITTLVDHISLLSDQDILFIKEAVEHWLLNPKQHAKISVDYSWVLIALLKVFQCDRLYALIDAEELNSAIENCTQWLLYTQQETGGWADNEGEKASTTRTALALRAFNEEYNLYKRDEGKQTLSKALRKSIDQSTRWLLDSQNTDGGWGNIRARDIDFDYQKKVNLSYADLRFQCESNAACTGYAMVALSCDSEKEYGSVMNKASGFIHQSQQDNGCWPVFMEVGVRDGKKFTFRHFGTTWALTGLLLSHLSDFSDECVMKGLYYLTSLQDKNFGGWKCSEDADNYTWATCNALDTIRLIRDQIMQVESKDFFKIVYDWWRLKKREANFSFQVKGIIFAFNGAMGFAFCATFTIMMLLLVFLCHKVLIETPVGNSNIANGAFIIIASVLLGLPWIIWVQNVFHKEMDNWINSIGWVYGIITGFVLVFYQYFL